MCTHTSENYIYNVYAHTCRHVCACVYTDIHGSVH